jgi:hypothetical protein
MSKNERAIYWLVAQGRMTVAEAERLLAASGNREAVWLVITVVLLAVLVASDPSVWLAGAAQGMLQAIPCCGQLLHRLQTAIMGV